MSWTTMRRLFAIAAALLLVLAMAATAMAHQVTKIVGTVDCQGNYSITVTGDVYDGVHLIVILGGTTIYDQAQNGTSATQTFGPFTGTGATAGESIVAKTSDGSQTSGELTLTGGPCSTPTPPPTPTPTTPPTATAAAGPNCGYYTVTVDEVSVNWSIHLTPVGGNTSAVAGGPFDNVGNNVIQAPAPFIGDTVNYQFYDDNGPVSGFSGQFTIEACASPSPSVSPSPSATPTPVVTPSPTPVVTPTPGKTPPPTSTTGGNTGDSGSSVPLFAVLICGIAGMFGLLAVNLRLAHATR